MHAIIDEPTHRVVWDVVDQETVRVRFVEDDSSDGIPSAIEPETSRTTAVTIPDLDAAIAVLIELAQRDRIPLVSFAVRVDERTPLGQARALRLCIADWWRFRTWFPKALQEAERIYFRTMEHRKAEAIVFRLRLFAGVVHTEMPPLNYTVLCLE